MQVSVRFFASLREIVGVSSLCLELPEASSVETAWEVLAARHPTLASRRKHVAASVDRRYAEFGASLSEGCEVVFIPPVSGG